MAQQGPVDASDKSRARMNARLRPTFIAIAVMAGTMAFIAYEWQGVLTPPWLYGWTGYMMAVDLGLLASVLLAGLPGSPIKWPPDRWARFSRIFSVGFSVGVVVGVWILLPPAGPALRMVAVLLLVWFIAMMMMSSGTLANMIGCMALLVSLLAFVVTSDMEYRWQIGLFLVCVGAALVGIRRAIWRAADEAAAARDLSERAAAVLEQGMALVEAQRDAKTRFIAAASHDLQQPLQAARLFVDQLDALPPGAGRARALAGATRALDSSQGLIGQMLDFLRLEADAEVARPRPLALGPLLREIAADQAASGLRVIALGEAMAVADPLMLRRALGNLVGNAVKHSGATRLLLAARRSGERVRVWVIDDGCGIAPADRATLFDDFSQGAGAAPGGFGLGLASARRLAAAMDGNAGLEPRWTNGAAFYLDLPSAPATEVVLCEAA